MNQKETSIVFTGDIGFDRYMAGKWTDPQLLDSTIQNFFDTADHVAANVEGALLKAEDTLGKGRFFHTMDPEATSFLRQIHADVWCIANNHTMDAEEPGLLNTLKLAKENGAQTLGAGMNSAEAARPAYLPEAGGIGILGVGYEPNCITSTDEKAGCLSWKNDKYIQSTIREIKKTCRWCILVSHGGEEFDTIPLPYIREHYHHYLEMGADIVIGHHPHVVQNYEVCPDGKIIFYSLGNFIFDTDYQRAQLNSDKGVLVKLFLREDGFRFESLGMQLQRGEERLHAAPEPAVFTDLSEDDFEKLTPLAARVFLDVERKRRRLLQPDKFANATEADWEAYFNKPYKDADPGLHMDYGIIRQLAAMPDRSAEASPAVREYLLAQLPQ